MAEDISSRDTVDVNTVDLHNNRDPLTGAPGAHPVGTGVGATGGAIAGAAVGAIGGPIGAAIGLAAGAIAGGLGGKAVAENVNPTVEDAHWRDNYENEPYYQAGFGYDDYRPAYELGWSSRATRDTAFDELEPGLGADWTNRRGTSTLDWPQARDATRAAWHRADRTYFADDREMADLSGVSGASTASNRIDAGQPSYADALANDEVVDVLNDLLEISRDGEYGFRALADDVKASSQLKQIFGERAAQCRIAATELMAMISQYGGTPADGGTAGGAVHRGWVHVKAAVGANGEESMLDECERGEDAAVAAYRKALKQNLPIDVLTLVQRQADGAQRNHDQIKMLRDESRERGWVS